MTELTASRTLVKSPPELWAECSDAASLSRHLDRFGEIRITRLEPETVVAWEGESASGTVRLEPSGWGTRVVLTAQAAAEAAAEAAAPPVDEPAPFAEEPPPTLAEPPAAEEPAAPTRRGAFARLRRLFGRRGVEEPEAVVEPEPEAVEEPEPVVVEPEPVADPEPGQAETPAVAVELHALEQALDSLGQAHHRPFSRA